MRIDLRTGTYIEEPRVVRVDTYLESPTARVLFRNQAPAWMRNLDATSFARAAKSAGYIGAAIDAIVIINDVIQAPSGERVDTVGQGLFRFGGAITGAVAIGKLGLLCQGAAVVCVPVFGVVGGVVGGVASEALYDPATSLLEPAGEWLAGVLPNPYDFYKAIYGIP